MEHALAKPGAEAREPRAERQVCAPILKSEDASGAKSGKEQKRRGIDDMFVNDERVRVRMRTIKYRKVVKKHEYGAGDARNPDEDAEGQRDTDEGKTPFVQEINRWQYLRLMFSYGVRAFSTIRTINSVYSVILKNNRMKLAARGRLSARCAERRARGCRLFLHVGLGEHLSPSCRRPTGYIE